VFLGVSIVGGSSVPQWWREEVRGVPRERFHSSLKRGHSYHLLFPTVTLLSTLVDLHRKCAM
jgi:hypothetical protein